MYKGAAVGKYDPIGNIMSLRDTQGAVGEARFIQGDAMAKLYSTDG